VDDPQAHLLDLDSVQATRRVGNETGLDVTAIAFGPSGNMLLIGTLEGALSAWDMDTGAQLWVGSGHDARINDIAVERERDWVATASDDGTVRTWDMREGDELSALALSTPSPLVDVAYSPDGGIIAAAGLDGLVHLWDTASGEEMPPLGADTGEFGFISLALHADEGAVELAAAKEDGSIWRWDLGSRSALPSPPPGEPVHAIAYDDRHLITAHDSGTISLWYLDAMDALPTLLAGHTAGINDLIVDPQDEAYLLSAGNDGSVRRWDLVVASLVEKACRGAGRTISADELKWYLPSQPSDPAAGDVCGETFTHQ
jgi:WD40 repeat protein